jgi:hypothetical protein
MAAVGLAAALMAPAGAAAKPAPVAPLTVEILDHAKLDKRTGVAHVRTRVSCPVGYRVIIAELGGGQDKPVVSPGSGGIGRVVCDGRRHTVTSDSFAPGVFGEEEPAWRKGRLSVTATLIVDNGEESLTAQDSETIKLH